MGCTDTAPRCSPGRAQKEWRCDRGRRTAIVGFIGFRKGSVYAEVFLDFFNLGVGLVDGIVIVGSGFHLAFDFDVEFDFGLGAGRTD